MAFSSNENAMTLIQEQELIGFWDWEISSRKKYLSPVIKQMLGYEEHEILNDPDAWINLILKEDQQSVINSYQKHVSSRGAYPYEVRARFRHKNGSIVHILSKGKITEWDYMGNPVRMIGYDTDVTGIIKEFTALEERNEQFKTVIDIMNAGIWSYDVYKGKQYWSDNFYNAIGYNAGEIAPTYFNLLHVLTHPEDNGKLVKAIDDQVKHKIPYSIDVRLQNKEGVYNWFETSGKVSYNEENRPSKITGFIVKRKEGVETAALTEVAAEPPVKLPVSGEFEYDLNRARFTFSKEVMGILELGEDAPLKFEPVNNMFTDASQEAFQEGFNKAVYARENYEIILTCTTPKGYVKTLREKAGPVIDNTGKVIALKGTIEELESRKATEAELSGGVSGQIAEQNKRLLNFAHIASHNLRSHASNLQMILQVLGSTQNEEERKFCLDSLEKIASSLSKSISNLNDLMAIETELNISRIPISFKEVLNNVTGTLSQQINDTKAVIESDFSKCPIIDYVPAYIESILLNLVSNAIKYRSQQRPPHIVLRTYMEDGKTFLTVKDNGMGIDLNKHKDKLFRMHQTFHNHPDSRGIGLLITKNQVEAMGGTIGVESEPGTGTTFTIKF
jgi:PAS domain S-box-containing protein